VKDISIRFLGNNIKFLRAVVVVIFCISIIDIQPVASQEMESNAEDLDELPVIPTPGPTPSEESGSKARSASDDEVDVAELAKKYGGELIDAKPSSAHWLRRNVGIRKMKNTGASDKDVPFCMYAYGKRDPSICFNPETREKIYERGMDKSVLDEIKRKYREQGLMK
jgi:hypothetical protein